MPTNHPTGEWESRFEDMLLGWYLTSKDTNSLKDFIRTEITKAKAEEREKVCAKILSQLPNRQDVGYKEYGAGYKDYRHEAIKVVEAVRKVLIK